MKLLRWALGGASAYVIYKYSIGKKAKGEDVFQSPDKALAIEPPKAEPQPEAVEAAGTSPKAKAPATT